MIYPRIIVEGMDSTGKTTLIEYLHSQFHMLTTVRNDLGPEQDFDNWWMVQLQQDRSPFVAIHDRFFYSELVYGPILRGWVKAKVEVQRLTAEALRQSALLIYARPDAIDVQSTLNNKEQMEGVSDKFSTLLKSYDRLMLQERPFYGPRFTYYDWRENKDGGHKRISELVERYLVGELP